jgi:hypothetical protein
MGNVKLIFGGTEDSNTTEHELEVYVDQGGDSLIISIEMNSSEGAFIFLDKSTAIKFSKELRKQIAILNS